MQYLKKKNQNMNSVNNLSNIVEFLNGSRIFITGGTGFLGSAFIEKILRGCEDVEVFLLMRSKRRVTANERLEQFLQKSIFDKLKETQPNFFRKITLISGDVTLPKLGLNQNDLEILIENVNCIIHCAANINFSENLRTATCTNIGSTIELVEIGKKIKNLKSFLHVSTAYSYSHLNKVDEEFYESPILAEELLNIVKTLNDEQLQKETPKLLGKFLNTYVFTKAIAEDFLKRKAKELPIAIFRPAIILGSCKEPTPGWIDNINGPTGTFIAASLGILQCSLFNPKKNAELVPIDYVANCGIAVLASISTEKNNEEIKIFNFVSSPSQPITWGSAFTKCIQNYLTFPSVKNIWSINFKIIDSWIYFRVYAFFFNIIRGFFLDIILYLMGQKPFVLKTCRKILKLLTPIKEIVLNESIVFTNDNVKELWKSLNEMDRKLFEFDMRNFDWDLYFFHYVKGIRVHLLNDPMETAEIGRKKYKKLKTIDLVLKQSFVLILILFLGYFFFF